MTSPSQPGIRVAELVALLSLGTDLGFGQPMEHAIRQCLIALRLGERLNLSQSERVVVYYSGLLAWVGCHTDAYEQAKWFGDDISMRKDGAFTYDGGRKGAMAAYMLKYIGGTGRPLIERAKVGASFLHQGKAFFDSIAETHYLATDGLAAKLGLGQDVRDSLRESYERWDGKGAGAMKGDSTLVMSRLVNLADVVEVFERTGGTDAAIAVARERSGTQFDPSLVELFCSEAESVFAELDPEASWDAVIAAEPALGRVLVGDEFDTALDAIADFTDLKSPWTIGHSRGVADMVTAAGRDYGLSSVEMATLRQAALLHDLGRLGVSNGVWDKRGALSHSEMERVRLHPYLSERMLAFSPTLAPLAAIAVQHHERLDGSGYPRGLRGDAITPLGRLLAAADCYHTMTEMRPHRPAKSRDEAARALREEVAAGRLDGDAANALLRADGHVAPPRRELPAGLTRREVEVLKLLVRALSNKEIAERLVIAPKTAGNHVEHIYGKIGVSNRARAALFAVSHGLMAGLPVGG